MIKWIRRCVNWYNNTMARYPALDMVLRAFLFTVAVHWCIEWLKSLSKCNGFQSNDSTYPANSLPPLFAPHSVVVEITNGSMNSLSDVVSNSPVSMVMLYAPWCHFSRKTAINFEQAALSLRDEISFVAINCWSTSGKCHHVYKDIIYPTILGYFAYGKVAINYQKPLSYSYLVTFGKKLVRPIYYVGTYDQFVKNIEEEELMVLGYFDFTSRKPYGFLSYHRAALSDLDSELLYGVVTNPTVAGAIGLPYPPSIVMYSRTHGIYQYFGTGDISAILNWTSTNSQYRIVNKLQWNGVLNAPSAVLFVPINDTKLSVPILKDYRLAAARYSLLMYSSSLPCHNLRHFEHSTCTSQIPQCVVQYEDYCSRYCTAVPDGKLYSVLNSQSSIHDSVLVAPNSCMYKCYPLELSFHYADTYMFFTTLKKLGLQVTNKPSLVVVDPKSELEFVMDSSTKFDSDSIFQFLHNISKGLVAPFYRTVTPPNNPVVLINSLFNISVMELVGSTFTSVVMDPNKDVVVAHYSDWCGHCLSFWPLYYSLVYSYHTVNDLLFTRIDNDRNDLLPCHQVIEFPSIVLYLRNRKLSPVVLPKESLASLDTLVSSIKDSTGNTPTMMRDEEAEMILQKEDWSHHGWYLWKMVEQERRQLEEENRKLTRTVFELQRRLDENTERKKPIVTDFNSLASELQKMMTLFSTVEIDTTNKEKIVHNEVCEDSDCKKEEEEVILHWNNKPDDQSNSLH
ncbi:uncharacterized protein [Dysidea avara]|uniref:uncharacterized protein isoform X2 n=1 Tax=Dysidea avara TaxID=196820 RepID=UPI003323FD71